MSLQEDGIVVIEIGVYLEGTEVMEAPEDVTAGRIAVAIRKITSTEVNVPNSRWGASFFTRY